MANTFKVVSFAAEPASSGTPYVMYTAASSTTTIVLGLILSNIHTSQVTATVRLVSDTGSRGGSNNVTNGTSIIIKDAPKVAKKICVIDEIKLLRLNLIIFLIPIQILKI